MSTCPEKDIHSIYLDNELPENFKSQYESHIAICKKCKTELEKLRAIHSIFKTDSDSLNVDNVFLAQSYERLQQRLNYSKVVSRATPTKKFNFIKINHYVPAAIAALAVFAIMLPININSKKEMMSSLQNSNVATIQQIKRTTDFSINQNQMVGQTAKAAFPISLGSAARSDEENEFFANYATSFTNNFAKSGLANNNFSLRDYSAEQVSMMINNFENDSNPINGQRLNQLRKVYSERKIQPCSKLLADDFFMPDFVQNTNSAKTIVIYLPTYTDISAFNK